MELLKTNKIKLGIVTSKDIKRTKVILKKFKIPIKIVVSAKKIKGKTFSRPNFISFKKTYVIKKKNVLRRGYVGRLSSS